jgi:hypothetical protein
VPPVWRAANRAAASAVLSRASALYRASPGHAAAVAAAAAAMRRRGHGRGETAEAPLERPIFRIAPVASTVSDGRCGPSVASSVGASVRGCMGHHEVARTHRCVDPHCTALSVG